jgi:hypothetical protein
MNKPMDLGDAARVATPTDAIERRLGYVGDVHFSTPHTTHVRCHTLLFPGGTERTYPAEHVLRCTRADDRAALEAAFTEAYGHLRDACRIAHDFNADLSDDTARLLRGLVDVARGRLGLPLVSQYLRSSGMDVDGEGDR